jgi:hypothetical protein
VINQVDEGFGVEEEIDGDFYLGEGFFYAKG